MKRAALLLVVLAVGAAARAQPPPEAWALFGDGRAVAWRPRPAWTPDSLQSAARGGLLVLQRNGFPQARLDSAVVDSGAVRLYATLGAPLRARAVRVEGAGAIPEARLLALAETRAGAVVRDSVLAADVRRILAAYAAAGLPLARAEVAALAVTPDGADVTFRVDEGNAVRLAAVRVPEGARTSARFAARVAGVRAGRVLRSYDPARVAERLRATGFYRRVGAPAVEIGEDGRATLVLDVDEAPPGAFDLVLGLLPPATPGARAQFIGTGSLDLQNLFGAGYGVSLRLNRLPGQTASASARASGAYLFGGPLRASLLFDGLQQDSTLATQRYRAEAGYTLSGVEVVGLVTRDGTRPGQAGARVSTTGGTGGANARQRIARSDATFTGLGLRYARLDAPANPRRGALLDVLVEAGRRARAFTEAREDGLVRVRTRERQERVEAHARAYVPTFARQAFVVGGDFYALRSPTFDEGDLFRFGGAATLRGYDEERFRARTAARALAEYRYALDAGSYAFAFADAGYVDQPDLRTPDDAANDATRQTLAPERGLFPGYGVGLQLSTAVGLVTATYAASPESGLAQGRVHVGLAFGL